MKKILTLILAAMGLIIIVSPIGAEPASIGSEKRVAAQEHRDEIKLRNQTRREEFQTRLATMSAERKVRITERINTQLNHINQVVTGHFLKVLTRLRGLLVKLADRVEKHGGQAEAEAAIVTAEGVIATAEEAVNVQAQVEYVIEFSDEAGLRVGASETKEQLREDLNGVRELVKEARRAVVEALRIARGNVVESGGD